MRKTIDNFELEIFNKHIKEYHDNKIENIFQSLSFDLLKIEKPNIIITPFETESKDGSIDHYAAYENETIIIECKKNNTLDNLESAISQLKSKLLKGLDKTKAKENLYKPWFKPSLSKYIFMTSCTLKTAKEKDEISDKLTAMMNELSKLDGLCHLENINIELFCWNRLKPILEDNPFYFNKWIENDILGIKPIEEKENSRYKRNLYNENLPYISIKEFNSLNTENNMESAEEIYDNIFKKDEEEGIFIYGEGGVGKTRLMHELGFMALRDNWIVYKVTSELESLKNLNLKPENKYCLLFDYIEENRFFQTTIVSDLKKIYPYSKIKVLANSRASYLQTTTPPEGMYSINLSSNKEYLRYVTKKILEGITVEEDYLNVNPSFAVYIKEEFEKDRHLQKDFKKYLKKRISTTLSVDDITAIKNETISILSSLSFSTEEKEIKDKIKLLVKDGWIVKNDNNYSSEHDTIIDKLLEIYIEQEKFDEEEKKEEIEYILENSLNTYSTFRTLDRCSIELKNKEIGYDFFYNLIGKYLNTEVSEDFIDLVSKTSLLDIGHRFRLYIENIKYFNKYIETFNFIYPLSFAIYKYDEESNDNLNEVLKVWLNKNLHNIDTKKESYRIISACLSRYSINHQVSNYALTWLKEYPLEKESRFVLNSWLNVGGDIESVREYVLNWIEMYSLERETQFVIKSWLDAKGDIESVKEHILNWMEKYSLKEGCDFVIKSWLNALGDIESVRKYVLNWMEEYPLEKETHFIIKSWLDAKGDIESVEKYVIDWIVEYPLEKEISFILSSWLDAKGDIESVRKYVLNWLKEYPLEKETHFIIKSWLDAKGDIESVREYILNWIVGYPLEKETRFVLSSWLDAKGDIESVRKYVLNWMEKYSLKEGCDFVIKSWLDSKGDIESVRKYVLNWIKEYPLEKETHFVIKSWLDAKGDIKSVKEYTLNWLEKYPLEEETNFIIKSWLNAGGDVRSIRNYVLNWLKVFPLEKEADFIIRSWLDAGGNLESVEDYALDWIEKYPLEQETSFTIKSLLKRKVKLDDRIIEIFFNWIKVNKESNDIEFVLKRIFKIPKKIIGDIPNDITTIAFNWCRRNIDNKEIIFMLSYLSKLARFHPRYLNLSRKVIDVYVDKNLNEMEIMSFESIIYSNFTNKNFNIEDEKNLAKWLSTEYSFNKRNSERLFFIGKNKDYYNKLKELSNDNNRLVKKLNDFFEMNNSNIIK